MMLLEKHSDYIFNNMKRKDVKVEKGDGVNSHYGIISSEITIFDKDDRIIYSLRTFGNRVSVENIIKYYPDNIALTITNDQSCENNMDIVLSIDDEMVMCHEYEDEETYYNNEDED